MHSRASLDLPQTPAILPLRDRSFLDCTASLPVNFARIVAAHGSRKAIGAGSWRPSYDELNIAANRVAAALLARGGSPGDRAAILMDHDGPLIGAILATCKAGRIAVVLNTSHPPDRLRRVIENAGARWILTDARHRDLAAEAGDSKCEAVQFEDHFDRGPAHDPDIRISADTTAVLVYTSGSTGRPKAVMQQHDQIADMVRRHNAIMDFGPEDKILLMGSPSGTQGYIVVWCGLLNGASLCPFPIVERGVTGLAGWLREHGVNIFSSSASIFRQFMKTLSHGERLPFVRAVRLMSEPATSDDFRIFQDHFPGQCRFVHTFGSSEAGNTCHMSLTIEDQVAEGRLPIGHLSPGLEIFLVDEKGQQVAPGEPGDIVVRGRYLSAGYWRDEALTSRHFSVDPETGLRLFRSSDQARLNADGLLEFVGRTDAQVKVRGYRIDLADVAEALLGVPAVERAIVLPRALPSSDTQLVAYLTLRKGQAASAATLRGALRAVLPSQMVPQAFLFLDEFPLTSHGKIDREKLLQMNTRAERPTVEVPQTKTEALLVDLWREALDLPEVGRQDDFFDLGGDSLSAATVAAGIYDAIGVELSLAALTENPSLAALASIIEGLRHTAHEDDLPPLVGVPREPPPPLSFQQERIWQYSQSPAASAAYVIARPHQIIGPLDVERLRDCMSHLLSRHEMLRTTFPVVDGRPVQRVHPPAPADLEFVDLSGTPDPAAQISVLREKALARNFDLSRLPLFRFLLIRISEQEHLLYRVSHHVISDGSSWNVYFRELGLLYEAKFRGEALPLPAHEPLQYADYAAWQRDALRPERPAYRAAVAWWKENLRERPQPLKLPFRRAWRQVLLRGRLQPHPAQGIVVWGTSSETWQRLDALGRMEGATLFMVRLAIFVAQLAASTGERDIIIGSYMSNRNRVALQNMFGFFSNLATLRFRFDSDRTFREWLTGVRSTVGAAAAHSDIPYEELVKELAAQGIARPDIRVIFNMNTDYPVLRFAGLELASLSRSEHQMPWGFSMKLDHRNHGEDSGVYFDAGLYDPAGVRGFIERYKGLLEAVSSRPDAPLRELI